jgi:hypothetical protein
MNALGWLGQYLVWWFAGTLLCVSAWALFRALQKHRRRKPEPASTADKSAELYEDLFFLKIVVWCLADKTPGRVVRIPADSLARVPKSANLGIKHMSSGDWIVEARAIPNQLN